MNGSNGAGSRHIWATRLTRWSLEDATLVRLIFLAAVLLAGDGAIQFTIDGKIRSQNGTALAPVSKSCQDQIEVLRYAPH